MKLTIKINLTNLSQLKTHLYQDKSNPFPSLPLALTPNPRPNRFFLPRETQPLSSRSCETRPLSSRCRSLYTRWLQVLSIYLSLSERQFVSFSFSFLFLHMGLIPCLVSASNMSRYWFCIGDSSNILAGYNLIESMPSRSWLILIRISRFMLESAEISNHGYQLGTQKHEFHMGYMAIEK